MKHHLKLFALYNFPMVAVGDRIDNLIDENLTQADLKPGDGDILVIAQKIVSKAEGRYVDLNTIAPSTEANDLAATCQKDPRLVQAILDESTEVLRCLPGIIIVRHRLGLVLANAGIDQSNLDPDTPGQSVLLLPENPDSSARQLVRYFKEKYNVNIGVIINDSLGRAWRLGTTGTCIGSSGVELLRNEQGRTDLFGRVLQTTTIGIGDELAAAASLLMGQADEARPVVLVRGWRATNEIGESGELIRPLGQDLFP
jgi:coenzyme F420-0:L-glutamate ligase/coenzyme F420-1:gamma-L-glutamate ligase